MAKRFNFLPLVCILLFLTPSLVALFHCGFFTTDDGNWMIIRLSAFYETIRSGQFPVRYLLRLNNGYGYPVADFLYPLFMYVGVPIHILGFSFVNTVKVIIGLSFISSGLFTYFWLNKNMSKLSAFVGSVVTVMFPYHLWDIYKRGSVGEVLAMAIVPFIFWQIDRKNIAFSGLGIALLILSHNTLALLFLPVILGYLFIRSFPLKRIAIIVGLGFGVSAFFWVAALYDKQFTVFDSTTVSSFTGYFLNSSGYGLFIIPSLIAIIGGLWTSLKKPANDTGWFLLVLVASLFFALPVSGWFWHFNMGTSYIQFPFRLLSLSVVAAGFLSAAFLENFKGVGKLILAGIIMVLIYFAALSYLLPQEFTFYPDSFYSTNQDSTTVQNEYMPKSVKTVPQAQVLPKSVSIIKGDGKITDTLFSSRRVSFNIDSSVSSQVEIALINFPGWSAILDNKTIPLFTNSYGFVQLELPSGNHKVQVVFGETPVRLAGDVISILSLAICIYILGRRRNEIF